MRHGPAEDRAASGRDFDRVLTREGRSVVEVAARRFFASPSGARLRVLVSPFRRAAETATILAAHAKLPLPPEVDEVDDLAADAGVLPLELIARLVVSVGPTDALLVGHQPMVEALASKLAGGRGLALDAGFRTAMIVSFAREDHDDAWRVAGVIDPHTDG